MWRRNAFPFGANQLGSHDSDQSISEEEEDLDGEWIKPTVSLGNEGGLRVPSHHNMLADCHELGPNDTVSILSTERKMGICIEDEVENSLSDDEDNTANFPSIKFSCHSSERLIDLPAIAMASVSHFDEEINSDDEKVSHPPLESAQVNVDCAWSEASREVDALVRLHEKSGCSSSQSHGLNLRENRPSTGGSRTKAKSKLLFRFQSQKKDQSWVVSDGKGKMPSLNFPMVSEIHPAAHGVMNEDMAESQLIFHEEESEQLVGLRVSSELAHKQDSKQQSVAEFLNCLQERSGLMQERHVGKRGRKVKIVKEKNMPPLGCHGNLDDDEDDLTEAFDSGPPTPRDDEKNLALQENHESLKSIRRTMADQFHDAFGTMSTLDGRPHIALPRVSSGLFGQLQQVMQSEKERDATYLKNLSSDTGSTVEKSISVRISSRSLEAKLNVCSCTCLEDEENNFQMTEDYSAGRMMTVIFSPRICSDVEIEVGNLIRIHSPWKEVKVKEKGEIIILCLYFSQIQS